MSICDVPLVFCAHLLLYVFSYMTLLFRRSFSFSMNSCVVMMSSLHDIVLCSVRVFVSRCIHLHVVASCVVCNVLITLLFHACLCSSMLDHCYEWWSLRNKRTTALSSDGSQNPLTWLLRILGVVFGIVCDSSTRESLSGIYDRFPPGNAFQPKCLFWSPLDALEGPWSAEIDKEPAVLRRRS